MKKYFIGFFVTLSCATIYISSNPSIFPLSLSHATLEMRYSIDAIIKKNSKMLLPSPDHNYISSKVCYHPYALFSVKYPINAFETYEGVMLWDLIEGEVVQDAETWEKTHGFAECIAAGIRKGEYSLIQLLAQSGGSLDREGISDYLHGDHDTISRWISMCKKKNLIIEAGNYFRLHMREPKMDILPHTNLDKSVVTKEIESGSRAAPLFTIRSVIRSAYDAFGDGFVIQDSQEVLVPVVKIKIENPDGSIETSLWSSMNGKQITKVNLF